MFSKYGPLCAEVYDATKPIGHEIDGDLTYYKHRLIPVTGRILEVGVGTGRILVPLLESGFKIDGIDRSIPMLDVCRFYCETRNLPVQLFLGKVEEMKLPSRYEAIIMPGQTISLLEGRANTYAAFESVFHHLEDGGRFIFDFRFPYDWQDDLITTKLIEDIGMTVERKNIELNWLEQYAYSIIKYEHWENGDLIASELQPMKLYWYSVEELTTMLQRAGFRNVVVSSNYSYDRQPRNHDDKIILEATK